MAGILCVLSLKFHNQNQKRSKNLVNYFHLIAWTNYDKVFHMRTNVSDRTTKENLYVVREHAVPEVLIKVAEANRLLESGKVDSVQDAAESVGISRSSYYKYKDDISLFHENSRGRTVNLVIQLDDERGMLSNVLRTISDSNVNILTIQQSVPVRGIASVILSLDMNQDSVDPDHLAGEIEGLDGIHYVKILARE